MKKKIGVIGEGHNKKWFEKIENGMELIKEGCKENKGIGTCRNCDFYTWCEAMTERGYVQPMNWR